MTNKLLNYCKDHPLVLALLVSAILHSIAIFWQWMDSPSQSSLGSGQVLLLEHVPELPAKTELEPETQIKSQKSGSVSNDIGIGRLKEKVETTSNKSLTEVKSDSPINKQAGAPKSKGALIDQSGKAPTAKDQYRQAVLQHILKKTENSKYFGSAIVSLEIIPAGFAINVQVTGLSGNPDYPNWLKGKVLNSNPMPSVPAPLKSGNLKLKIQVSHVLDEG